MKKLQTYIERTKSVITGANLEIIHKFKNTNGKVYIT